MTLKAKLGELEKALGDVGPKKLRQQVAIALNQTAKKAKNVLAKEVADRVSLTQKRVKQDIRTQKAKPESLVANIVQKETSRISLKDYKARQTKSGISYKIEKIGKRTKIKSAFISEKLGGHAYKRTSKKRLPIIKLYGPSAWGVTVVNKLDKLIVERDVEPDLLYEIDRRIQAINFKKTQGQ